MQTTCRHSRQYELKTTKLAGGPNEAMKIQKKYSRRVSTTFVPMKPLDPVTKMQSSGDKMCSEIITIS